MALPTIVKITGINVHGAIVKTTNEKSFYVNSFTPMNGVLDITAPMGSMTIYELAEIVSGCFEPDSTFENVKWVTFKFNTITVTVTLGEARWNTDYVVQKWKKAWDDDLKAKDKVEKFSAYLDEDIDE
ncbi:MAG: hypothetical protein E7314_06750 [Clostridiales bacterium]|nr:hypothetical protein [Clostridiales bacterium]